VKLANGETITACIVVSNAEVAATVDLVGEQKFDSEYVRKARSGWFEPCGNTISFALNGKPHFTGMPDESLKGFIGFNAERDITLKAYYEAQTGRIPEDPVMIGYLISEIDPGSYAPEGKHVMTVYAFPNVWDFADGSTWDDPKNKKQFYDNLVNSLTKYAPDFKDLLLAVDGFTPGELDKEFGMTRGDHQHGLSTWGYMLGFRPIIGQEPYTTPIDNLFLVGAPIQPTGISGYIGQNVANLVEPQWKDLKC
jgi:phytoene dehydrogenase-like protein